MKYSFKYIILFFSLLYVVITLLFFNFYKELAIKDTRQEALSILGTIKAIRSYIGHVQRPALINATRGKGGTFPFDKRLLSSSFITQYIYDIMMQNKTSKYEYRLASPNPLNPKNKATLFEEDVLEKFNTTDKRDFFALIDREDSKYFYIALPVNRNDKSCLQCHGNPNDAPIDIIEKYGTNSGFHEREGDLRAILSLKVAVTDILAYHKQEFISGGIAMFSVFVFFIFLVHKLYKKERILQKKKDKLMIQQNRLATMGNMIGNIAHQWKQPLAQLSATIIGIELLSEKDRLTKGILRKKTKNCNTQLKFMSSTIDDFKNFFNSDVICEHHPVKRIVGKSLKLLRSTLNKYEIMATVHIEDNFLLLGYHNEFTQVLVNIIGNAKDAFRDMNLDTENKKIDIRAFVKDEHNVLIIKNNAGNIPDDVMTRIFNPHFSTKDSNSSTGIGLSICRLIVEARGGVIYAENISDSEVEFVIKFKK